MFDKTRRGNPEWTIQRQSRMDNPETIQRQSRDNDNIRHTRHKTKTKQRKQSYACIWVLTCGKQLHDRMNLKKRRSLGLEPCKVSDWACIGFAYFYDFAIGCWLQLFLKWGMFMCLGYWFWICFYDFATAETEFCHFIYISFVRCT
jgi:hypothetical protein